MNNKLIELGLTVKEANVYIALIQSGDSTADQLAKTTKLNRSTTYVQITLLTERGLVTTFKRGKKTFFSAESPNNLFRIIEQKKQMITHQESEIQQLVPELLKMFGGSVDRPSVRVFEGKEGLISMRNSILDQKTQEIRAISSIDHMRKIFSKQELLNFTLRREQNGTKSLVMYSLEDGEDFLPLKLQTFKRISKDMLPFGCDIYIYGDSVSFASTDNQIVGLSITNKAIAATMKALFEKTWHNL